MKNKYEPSSGNFAQISDGLVRYLNYNHKYRYQILVEIYEIRGVYGLTTRKHRDGYYWEMVAVSRF